MEKTLQVINRMREERVFTSYAIGGGIGALFYIEPVATFDLDVFVILPDESGIIVSLSPVYSWLETRQYKAQKEQIVIEGIPVQFIPAYNELIRDAVQNSIQKKYGSTKTSVVRAEFLMAIMVQTFRPRDRERLHRFVAETTFDEKLFLSILEKHNLGNTYKEFLRNAYGKQ